MSVFVSLFVLCLQHTQKSDAYPAGARECKHSRGHSSPRGFMLIIKQLPDRQSRREGREERRRGRREEGKRERTEEGKVESVKKKEETK